MLVLVKVRRITIMQILFLFKSYIQHRPHHNSGGALARHLGLQGKRATNSCQGESVIYTMSVFAKFALKLCAKYIRSENCVFLKFRQSEKAAKIWPIFHSSLDLLSSVKS